MRLYQWHIGHGCKHPPNESAWAAKLLSPRPFGRRPVGPNARNRARFSTPPFPLRQAPVRPRPGSCKPSPRIEHRTVNGRRRSPRGGDSRRGKSVARTQKCGASDPREPNPSVRTEGPFLRTTCAARAKRACLHRSLSRLEAFFSQSSIFQVSHLLNHRSIETRAFVSRQQSSVTLFGITDTAFGIPRAMIAGNRSPNVPNLLRTVS